MKLPIAWLRDYLEIDPNADDIAARLASLGFPVDRIERRPELSGVVVGKLRGVEKHPGADRLQVCTVDVNGPRPLTIATAATNVAIGNVVPVATIGARLVGLTIAPRKMRGVDSEGMLCSASEVGLEEAWFEDGIMQLDDTLEIGADFVDTFRLCDDVLEVEITANRVDAMSVVGLARELAASLGRAIREPDTARGDRSDAISDARVTILSADCKRFVAQRFSGVRVRTAPFWMRVRLALAGQRPINNLVDISNFVMLETAQPLHFYDFDRVTGGELIVRDARAGESLRTLDEAERELDPRFLVIADQREPQGIAGLKGGADSEVTEATRELLVESATFAGPRIRRMSVALGLRTEASSRHEKGLPLGLSTWGAARAAYLLQREGAVAHPAFATGAEDVAHQPIRVPVGRFAALLGIEVSEDEATAALTSLGFVVRIATEARSLAHSNEAPSRSNEAPSRSNEAPARYVEAIPPVWRGDVRIAEDVVEEVARIVGYDRVVAAMPPVLDQHVSSASYHTESRVAHALAALGYREATTFSLESGAVAATYRRAGVALPANVVEIVNPLSEEQRYLRFSLLPALLHVARRGDATTRTFEIGHVFEGAPEPFETAGVAWMLKRPRGDEPAWHDGGFRTFKGESLALLRELTGRQAETVSATLPGWHPGKTATLLIDGRDVATIGAIDPRLAAAYDIDALVYAGWSRLTDVPAHRAPRYTAPSRFPAVARDLALVVAGELPAKDIEHAVRADANGIIAEVAVFDEYRGPQIADGKKSVAVRVVLQRDDATLTDDEAERQIAAILERLRDRCGAQIRT